MMTTVFMLLLRGAAVLALALLAIRLARSVAASLRYTILAAALAATGALPVISWLVPSWHTGAIARVEDPAPGAIFAMPIAEVAGPATVASVAPAPVTEARPVPWGAIAGGVWLAGMLALLVRAAVGARRARGIARRATPVDGVAKHVTAAWRALDGEGPPPRIVASDEVEAPIVVGAIAPVVVVPRAASEWVAERWRVVLLHELAHVRRRDGLINVVAQLACCMHWVNPLAWLAARRMREERELAADDAVLRGGARPSTYAEHLIAIATAAPCEAPVSALAMASGFEARVVALLDGDRSRRPAGTGLAALVVAAAGLVTMFAACFSPDSPPPKTDDVVADEPAGPAAPLAKSPELQAVAEAELDAAIAAHKANGALAIVLDAKSGAVVALATRGTADARVTRAPGSTMKPFTFAAALEAGVVDTTTRLDCGNGERAYGDKVLRDASPRGLMDVGGVLAVSSNVGTSRLAELAGDRLAGTLRRYHIAAPAQIDTRTIEGVSMAIGTGIRMSALDLASAYTAIADGGIYHARDGASERVMPESVARTMLAMLERPVADAEGTGRSARIDGVRVAGKTGTVGSTTGPGNYASFAGIVPADAPRFVILVGVDGTEGHGGKVAAPVFAKIAASALARR